MWKIKTFKSLDFDLCFKTILKSSLILDPFLCKNKRESAEMGFSSVYLMEVKTLDKILGGPSFNPAPGFLWPMPKSKLIT
jgi:hypothetical protein